MNRGGRIVVGVDGSTRSVAALQWALGHATQMQVPVDAVATWTPGLALTPVGIGTWAAGSGAGTLDVDAADEALALEARQLANSCAGRAGAETSSVTVRTWAMRGSPGSVLCDLAGSADLLVVGPSGHGPLVGAVLGSVANYLVRHAPCPVVIVRDGEM